MNRLSIVIPYLAISIFYGCALTTVSPDQKEPTAPTFEEAKKGLRFAALGQTSRAIKHFSKSLQSQDLLPNQRAAIINNRGVAYKNSEQYLKAEADFSLALELHGEKLTRTWHNRAIVRFLLGDFIGATQDFERFMKIPETNASPYPFLWHYLAQERAGLDGKTGLKNSVDRLSKLPWPGVVADFLLTGKGKDTLLDQVNVVDREQSKENRCDAYFFMGEQALLAGNHSEARSWFNKTIQTKREHLNEYKGAKMELKLLDSDQDISAPAL